MKTKISEAAMIAKLGIDVYIVKVIIFDCCVIHLSYILELLMETCSYISGSNKPLVKGLEWRSEKQHP
jgi:hypothetical protein